VLRKVKDLIKRFLPLPARTANIQHGELLSRIDAMECLLREQIVREANNITADTRKIEEKINETATELAMVKHKLNLLQKQSLQESLKQTKTIFAVACVKDESDIIESFCRYTLTYCDGLIIYDDGSSDGTLDIIENIISEGLNVYLLHHGDVFSDDSLDNSFSKRKVAALNIATSDAISKHHADLVVLLDADEFLMSIDGNNPRTELELLDETIEYRIAWRTYVYEREADDNTRFLPFYFEEYRSPVYEDHYKTFISKFQFCHMNARIGLGQHYLEYTDDSKNVKLSNSTVAHNKLALAHYPLRSTAQAIKKVLTFRKAHAADRNLPDAASWHLRKMYEYVRQHGNLTPEQVRCLSLIYSSNLVAGMNVENISTNKGVIPDLPGSLPVVLKYTDYKESEDFSGKVATVSESDIADYAGDVFVSVIIPVYNTESYLEECLDSIKNQTLKHIEIICIDDGSTDDSLSIIKAYAQNDNRFIVLSQPNAGLGATRNIGLANAKGSYVYFMDSDDILEIGALEFLYNEATRDSLDILYFDGSSFFETEQLKSKYPQYLNLYERQNEYSEITIGYDLFNKFVRDNCYLASACLQFFRRDFLLQENICFPEGITFEDNLFTLMCILKATNVSHRRKQLFRRRVRENSIVTEVSDYRKFYDFYRCYWAMITFLYGKEFDDITISSIQVRLDDMQSTALAYFQAIHPDELHKDDKKNKLEQAIFQRFVLPNKGNVNND